MARKKQAVLRNSDVDVLLKETFAAYIAGRIMASYAAILTNRERSNGRIIYQLLKEGRIFSKRLPLKAYISVENKKSNKYTPAEAITKFREDYPVSAKPLLALLEEKETKDTSALVYGLKGKKDLPAIYYTAFIARTLGISRKRARTLYTKIVKPEFKRRKEESGLVKIAMKE